MLPHAVAREAAVAELFVRVPLAAAPGATTTHYAVTATTLASGMPNLSAANNHLAVNAMISVLPV